MIPMHRQGGTPSSQEIQRTVASLRTFDHGQKTAPLLAVEKLIIEAAGNRELRKQVERELVNVLQSDASLACKQFICQNIAMIGASSSVPVLAKMLEDSDCRLAEAACYALAQNPSSAVAAALRRALRQAKGNGLVAVINVVGERRDTDSAATLAELATGRDERAADAAIAALGKIATPEATRTCSMLLEDSQGWRRVAAAHALLQSTQELAVRNKTAAASEIYGQLTGSSTGSRIPQSRYQASHPLPDPAKPKRH